MANSLQLNANNVVAGLGTFSYTVTSADIAAGLPFVTMDVQSSIPRDPGSYCNSAQLPFEDSNLQIVIRKNAVAQLTVGGAVSNPTPNQPSMGATARIAVVAGDIVDVVLSSAAAIDNRPNSIKSNVNLVLGV